MKFTYTYRSSDGQRHTAEIEAESRDAAFTRVRTELGIRPIKVTVAEETRRQDGGSPYGRGKRNRSRWIWGAAILAAILVVAAGGVVWWMQRSNRESQTANGGMPAPSHDQPITVAPPQGPVTLRVATPLPRQMIPGDRKRIADAAAAFKHPAEAWLARFAEPGRQPTATGETPVAPDAAKMAAPHTSRPTSADFETALREPIRIASTDFTEVVDLKRIVTGMKREMHAYIAGGGTVEQYLAELEKRQRLEISYRDNAERRLTEILNGQDARSPSATGGTPVVPDAAKMATPHAGGTPVPVSGQDARSPNGRGSLKAAYAYWLKANAQLQAMGIYPLALPDALRSYQMSLDIEE